VAEVLEFFLADLLPGINLGKKNSGEESELVA
jgi:hypothetical protein